MLQLPEMDEAERTFSIHTNTHHDLTGLLGYCMKEQTGPPWMNKGFTEAELLVASEHYRLQKDKAISKKNHKHVSQDQFYELMKDTHDKLLHEWNYHKPITDGIIKSDIQVDMCIRSLLMEGYNILPHCTKSALSTLRNFWDNFVNSEERWDAIREIADEVIHDEKNIIHMYNGKTRTLQSREETG